MYARVRDSLKGAPTGRNDDDEEGAEAAQGAMNQNSRARMEQAAKSVAQSYEVEEVSAEGRSLEEVKAQLDERVSRDELRRLSHSPAGRAGGRRGGVSHAQRRRRVHDGAGQERAHARRARRAARRARRRPRGDARRQPARQHEDHEGRRRRRRGRPRAGLLPRLWHGVRHLPDHPHVRPGRARRRHRGEGDAHRRDSVLLHSAVHADGGQAGRGLARGPDAVRHLGPGLRRPRRVLRRARRLGCHPAGVRRASTPTSCSSS